MGMTQKSKWTQWCKMLNNRNELIGFYRTNGKKVQVRAMNNDIRGEATCNKCDTFNLYIGINIAYMRMVKKVIDETRSEYMKFLDILDKEELDIKHKMKNLINTVENVVPAEEH